MKKKTNKNSFKEYKKQTKNKKNKKKNKKNKKKNTDKIKNKNKDNKINKEIEIILNYPTFCAEQCIYKIYNLLLTHFGIVLKNLNYN